MECTILFVTDNSMNKSLKTIIWETYNVFLFEVQSKIYICNVSRQVQIYLNYTKNMQCFPIQTPKKNIKNSYFDNM